MIFIVLLGCNGKKGTTGNIDIYKFNEIPSNSVKQINNIHLYEINFSNLVYEVNDKKVVIPIFNGELKGAYYQDFLNYCYRNSILRKGARESGFAISSRKGEMKKTLLNFIDFYKHKLKDDFNKPFEIVAEGSSRHDFTWFVLYKFHVNGIPCSLEVSFKGSEQDWDYIGKYTTVEEINPDEFADLFLYYDIRVN